jgi:hypothetical protein
MDRSANENEYRVSLIEFSQSSVNIKTWWTTEDRYALLSAALGDPEVDSIYPREYINSTSDAVMSEGVHMTKEEEDDSGARE